MPLCYSIDVVIHFLSDVFGLLSSKNFATLATWRHDFSLVFACLIWRESRGKDGSPCLAQKKNVYVLLCLNRVIVAVTMSVLMIIQPAVFAFLSFRKQLWVCPSNILRHGFIQDLSFGGEVPSGRRPRAFLRDPGGVCPPGNVFKWICAKMQSFAFWDSFEKCYSGILFYFLVVITFLVIQCLRQGILTSWAPTS